MGAVKELDIDLPGILDDIADSIATNAPGDVNGDYVDLCFQVKTGDGCETIYVKDVTDYDDLTRIDVDDSIVYASLWKIDCLCDEEVIVTESQYAPGDSWQYDDLEPGNYEVRIRIDYNLTGPTAEVEKEYVFPVTLDCCADDKEKLKVNLIEKIGALGKKIKEYGYMGKNTSKLIDGMYMLQLIQWGMCNCTCLTCADFENYKETYNKIIINCNC